MKGELCIAAADFHRQICSAYSIIILLRLLPEERPVFTTVRQVTLQQVFSSADALTAPLGGMSLGQA